MTVIDCGKPMEVIGGYWKFTNTIFNSTANLKCFLGYAASNVDTILCQGDGRWHTFNHTCDGNDNHLISYYN